MIPKQNQTKQDCRKVGENASATETNWKTVKFLMRSEEGKIKGGAGQKFLQTSLSRASYTIPRSSNYFTPRHTL